MEIGRVLGLGGLGARRLVVGVSGRSGVIWEVEGIEEDAPPSREGLACFVLDDASARGFGVRCDGFGAGAGRFDGGFPSASN